MCYIAYLLYINVISQFLIPLYPVLAVSPVFIGLQHRVIKRVYGLQGNQIYYPVVINCRILTKENHF